MEEGDIEEAMSAAKAVGDDAIQKRVQGQVTPDSFTHGTSKQRMKWFKKGFKSGDMRQGDTFSALLDLRSSIDNLGATLLGRAFASRF